MADTGYDAAEDQAIKAASYTPSEADQACLRLVEDRFDVGSQIRRPHEGGWFVVGAMLRGHQEVEWAGRDGRLVIPPAGRNKSRLNINIILPKFRARMAKFLKNRPVPTVIPATTDLDDRLDARATTKALDYEWRRLRLEQLYGRALRWAGTTDHGYIWLYWDEKAEGKIKITDQAGSEQVVSAPVGDIAAEVGSPFEVVVADPTITNVGDQPWIIRVKRRPLSYVKARYGERAAGVIPDGEDRGGESAGDRYAQQLSRLANHTGAGGVALAAAPAGDSAAEGRKGSSNPYVLIKEHFERPCDDYPRGRYHVVGGGVLLKEQDSLPYFYDFPYNPYPCVDFIDFEQPGQYWGTTIAAQAIPSQRERNLLRNKLTDHFKLQVHPKLIAYKQHNLAPGTWTNDSGEIVIANYVPGVPEIKPWHPPPISADVWKGFDLIDREVEDIFQIFPESEGQVGKSTSGFQTNLLQEATDAVHGPDIRGHELVIEELAYKIRRLMKLGFSPARLLTVTGRDLEPEAFEFHKDDIDENADIVVQAGSALPQLKAAKLQAVMELWAAGLLGDPNDPLARQKALSMLEMGNTEDLYDSVRKDEEASRLENQQFQDGLDVPDPEFFENHDIHYKTHTDALKGASSRNWSLDSQKAIRMHLIRHIAFVNPAAAIEHALRYGFQEIAMQIQAEAAMKAMVAPQEAPPPEGDPSAAPPPGGM